MLEVGLTFGALNAIWVASVSRVTSTAVTTDAISTRCVVVTIVSACSAFVDNHERACNPVASVS